MEKKREISDSMSENQGRDQGSFASVIPTRSSSTGLAITDPEMRI